jgi:hypothetical protein
MKTVNCWNDLLPYGLDPLTGEACGLSYRILFDLTAKGKEIVEKCLGCRITAEPWNRGSKEEPHVASIMLSMEMLVPLGIFVLLENGCHIVWLLDDRSLIGIEPSDTEQPYIGSHEIRRAFSYGGTAGDRNRHMMSGRIN